MKKIILSKAMLVFSPTSPVISLLMKKTCCSCHRPNASYLCPLCQENVCKACAQFMEDGTFSFLQRIPEELGHTVYCPRCYDSIVAPPLAEYNETMERAKNILVFYNDEGKRTRLLSRKEPPFEVAECLDREETILRLAFFATQANFNAIIDVDLRSSKVMNGSHRYLKWSGKAVPCHLEQKQLNPEYWD